MVVARCKRLFITLIALLFSPVLLAEFDLPNDLDHAIKTALVTHPEIAGANANVMVAQSALDAGEYRWFPTVDIGLRAANDDNHAIVAGISQTLWDAGRINSIYAADEALFAQSRSARLETLEAVGTRTTTAYLDILKARDQVKVAADNVIEHRLLLTSISNRERGGIGTASDVSLATSRMQSARATSDFWAGEERRTIVAYIAIVGEEPSPTMNETGNWNWSEDKDSTVHQAITRSPILDKLRSDIDVAEANAETAEAELYPTLSARLEHREYIGGVDNNSFETDTPISLNLDWQSDVVLTQRFRVDAAKHQITVAKQQLAAAERQVTQTVAFYWEDYTTAINRELELEKFANSAEKTLGQFRRQFNIGRRSWPEVMNAVLDVNRANTDYVTAKYNAMSASANLAFLAGKMDDYILIPDEEVQP